MITFAELDKNLVVKRVIVLSERNNCDENDVQDENIGISFCKKLYGENTIWKQAMGRRGATSKGKVYHEERDCFINPQPFPSWILNDTNAWVAPVDCPELTEEQIRLGYYYSWNEDQYQTNPENGWSLFTPQILTIDSQPADVSVSVGSSVDLTSTFSVNKGEFRILVQHKPDGEDTIWESSFWNDVVSKGRESVTAINNSGIVTTTAVAGEYRVIAFPSESGLPLASTSITLTVNE